MRAKTPLQEGFVEREGVKIHYEIFGEGRETMVFVPAWAIGHSRLYKAQVPYFSDRFRCIVYDPRGNGRSDRPERVESYRLDEYVGDLLAILDSLVGEPVILVGVSLGGMVASVVAAHHAARVKAAVLIGTTATIGPPNPYYSRTTSAPARALRGLEQVQPRLLARELSRFRRFLPAHGVQRGAFDQADRGRGRLVGRDLGRVLVRTVEARAIPPSFDVSEAMYRKIACPLLLVHGDDDHISPFARAELVAAVTGAELVALPGAGHCPQARFPAKVNTLIDDFLDRRLGIPAPGGPLPRRHRSRQAGALPVVPDRPRPRPPRPRVARELRKLHPDLQVDWLAQDPVTRLLAAAGERIHPLSERLGNESRHIELESDEHDLHAFQAIRRMDEILIANFMRFQQAVNEGDYDLVIADEAWDVDHYWHEHPELKKTRLAWFTDFVGFLPMPSGGEHEAFLAADYNAEMIGHIERHPGLRDRAIFVGNLDDIVPERFGADLPRCASGSRRTSSSRAISSASTRARSAAASRCASGSDTARASACASSPSAGRPSERR